MVQHSELLTSQHVMEHTALQHTTHQTTQQTEHNRRWQDTRQQQPHTTKNIRIKESYFSFPRQSRIELWEVCKTWQPFFCDLCAPGWWLGGFAADSSLSAMTILTSTVVRRSCSCCWPDAKDRKGRTAMAVQKSGTGGSDPAAGR